MRSLLFAVSLLGSQSNQNQEAPYPVFETDLLPAAEFKMRREAVKRQLGPGSIAVLFTNPVQYRNNDVDFQFRGDSNFLYLTGFEEPDAALVLVPDGFDLGGKRVTEVLFTNVTTPMSLTWLGYRMGPRNAERLLAFEAARPNTEFKDVLDRAASGKNLKVSTGFVPPDPNGALAQMVRTFSDWKVSAKAPEGLNLGGTLRTMRGIKSPREIALLKKASEISALAHCEAMRSMEPGMREYEMSWLVQYVFGKHGCEYPGYPPICGSGMNSTILHYNSNRRKMASGDIFCMDTAGEYHGYSADVTRSFPVNGKFTPAQRAIYNVVLRAQTIGIQNCKPGTTMGQISQKISAAMAEDMIKLGIIKEAGELRRYYMHGFGHGIGLDVHDPVPNTLDVGAVLTVEPGIYIKEGSPCDRKWWYIGIRIEDDILVTEQGPVNLSKAAPRDPDAIEKLMKQKGIGNLPVKAAG